MTEILSYKATALRNFLRKKQRIDSRIALLGKFVLDQYHCGTRCEKYVSGKKQEKANTTSAALSVLAKVVDKLPALIITTWGEQKNV